MDYKKQPYRGSDYDDTREPVGADHRFLTEDECRNTHPQSTALIIPDRSVRSHWIHPKKPVHVHGWVYLTPPSRFTKDDIDNTLLYFFVKQNYEIVDE
jgi:hypothetical protein